MKNWVKTSTTSSRLKEIMDIKHIKQAELSRITGISRGAISNYVLGRYEPKADIINKFATALNCSEMWLMGYDAPMERTDIQQSTSMELSKGEKMLLDLFRKIPESQQQMVLQMISVALKSIE